MLRKERTWFFELFYHRYKDIDSYLEVFNEEEMNIKKNVSHHYIDAIEDEVSFPYIKFMGRENPIKYINTLLLSYIGNCDFLRNAIERVVYNHKYNLHIPSPIKILESLILDITCEVYHVFIDHHVLTRKTLNALLVMEPLILFRLILIVTVPKRNLDSVLHEYLNTIFKYIVALGEEDISLYNGLIQCSIFKSRTENDKLNNMVMLYSLCSPYVVEYNDTRYILNKSPVLDKNNNIIPYIFVEEGIHSETIGVTHLESFYQTISICYSGNNNVNFNLFYILNTLYGINEDNVILKSIPLPDDLAISL